jgi:hypothetical protein
MIEDLDHRWVGGYGVDPDFDAWEYCSAPACSGWVQVLPARALFDLKNCDKLAINTLTKLFPNTVDLRALGGRRYSIKAVTGLLRQFACEDIYTFVIVYPIRKSGNTWEFSPEEGLRVDIPIPPKVVSTDITATAASPKLTLMDTLEEIEPINRWVGVRKDFMHYRCFDGSEVPNHRAGWTTAEARLEAAIGKCQFYRSRMKLILMEPDHLSLLKQGDWCANVQGHPALMIIRFSIGGESRAGRIAINFDDSGEFISGLMSASGSLYEMMRFYPSQYRDAVTRSVRNLL